MTTMLNYGTRKSCLLDSIEARCLRPQELETIALEQIASVVHAQLENPIGFPPLAQATIPGDRIAIAISPDIPQPLQVLEGVLRAMRAAGADEKLITFLLPGPAQRVAGFQAELATLGIEKHQWLIHDSENEQALAFLGVSDSGEAVRMNRSLSEADFVLPITATCCETTTDSLPPTFCGLIPEFSDRESMERFATNAIEQSPAATKRNRSASEQYGRTLGVNLAVQIVPAPGGQVAEVLAGDPATIAARAQQKYSETWRALTDQPGKLVIATLPGDDQQQTWQKLGRAIVAAETVLESDGVIVICSEATEPPGQAIRHLAGNEDYQIVERDIQHHPSSDSLAALRWCRALQRGSIYLKSQLPPLTVQGLGITPIESDLELERLAQMYRPCIILEEAQWLLPSLSTEGTRS